MYVNNNNTNNNKTLYWIARCYNNGYEETRFIRYYQQNVSITPHKNKYVVYTDFYMIFDPAKKKHKVILQCWLIRNNTIKYRISEMIPIHEIDAKAGAVEVNEQSSKKTI